MEAIDPIFKPLDLISWLNIELKKRGGHRTYQAGLVQSVAPSLNEDYPARYLVKVAGIYISFWEIYFETYHGRNNDNPDIQHLWGCRSLLQPSIYQGDMDFPLIPNVTPNNPQGIQPI